MWLAQLCEAFPGRLPSEVLEEAERLPAGMLEEVLEARAYMNAKDTYDRAEKKADLPKHWPMLDEVKKIDLQLAQEQITRGKAETSGG